MKGFAIGTLASLTFTPVTLLVSLVRVIVLNGASLTLFPNSNLYTVSVVQGFGLGLKPERSSDTSADLAGFGFGL